MKKFILASALMLSLFGISYGIATALELNGVVAKADCADSSCN